MTMATERPRGLDHRVVSFATTVTSAAPPAQDLVVLRGTSDPFLRGISDPMDVEDMWVGAADGAPAPAGDVLGASTAPDAETRPKPTFFAANANLPTGFAFAPATNDSEQSSTLFGDLALSCGSADRGEVDALPCTSFPPRLTSTGSVLSTMSLDEEPPTF